MEFCDKYIKIYKNNCEVFVYQRMITQDQYQQIITDPTLPLVRAVVPPIKLKKRAPKKAPKQTKAIKCDDSRSILNYRNESNSDNVSLNSMTRNTPNINPPKRKLRSDSIKNNHKSNEKKLKSDLKPIGGTSVSLNMSDTNQKKNKENQNNCNIELSRVIGLPNMGNTCYINSIIQVLRMTPGFRQFICSLNKAINLNKSDIKLKKSNKQLISSLHKIFVNFGNKEVNINKSATNESMITDLIQCEDLKNRFEFGQQQDCHEFLNWLINELNSFAELLFSNKKSSNNLKKNSYNTRQNSCNYTQSMPFQSFQGVMLRNIMCNECKRGSSTHDSFADIQIPLCVSEEMTDFCETQTFTQIIHRKDYLKDENMFDCHNCSKKTNASVVNTIEIPPKILIIFIKKPFEYNQMTTRNVKPMKKLFTVPLRLEYSSESLISYSLYGFVMHNGSDIDNGHYYAVIDSGLVINKTRSRQCNCALNVLANNGWIKVNDHKVCKLNSSHVNRLLDNDNIASTPYLAFYQRND